MITLKHGLARIIAHVERLPDNAIFRMHVYDGCVIGQTIGWTNGSWANARNLFGIAKPEHSRKSAFDCNAAEYYTDEEWSVIRLFTSDVGMKLTKQEWLDLAKPILANLK